RLVNLTLLPIFTDEAIYIRWSQIGSRDANWRFISLTDGKQPLFTWAMMAILRLLPSFDPLFVGRLTSVLAGSASLVGIWFLTWELFRNQRVAWIASALYLLSPFPLMYDRMALYDSMVATFYIWNLYLAVLLSRELHLDLALILGMTLGAGMLNKSSGFLSLYLLPVTLLLFDWEKKKRWQRLGRWFSLVIVAAIISQGLYSILRLSPLLHMVSQKDAVFIYPFSEWWRHPFRFVVGNLKGLFDWQISYLTKPVFLLSFLPLFFFWRAVREKVLLYLCWFLPFVALALFGRVLYPRFILFMTMPLLSLAALTLGWIWERFRRPILKIAIITLTLLPSLYASYLIIANPLYAPIPFADRGQYIDNWPAGWGIREVNNFLEKEAQKQKIAVYTEGTFGLLPYAVEIYLVDNPQIQIRGIWPIPRDLPAEILAQARQMPTFLVLNQTQTTPETWSLKLLAEYQKGRNEAQKLRLYQVIPTAPKKS
ncbi:MAG: ArnT family glycosyltransferase, partial [Patescibacteria group bacterium]